MKALSRRHFTGLVGIALAIAVAIPCVAEAARSRLITARAGILIDRNTGEILWQHNPDVPLPPASTTKIVTASLALQSGELDRSFAVSRKAAAEPPSNIRLRSGWSLELEDLIYAILLNSANDASVVIAEGLAGSVPAFAARMNVHAYTLGARHSHFINPNGLPAEGHVATARDLATILDHALDLPGFRDVLGTRARTIRTTDKGRRAISLQTKNRLLTNYRYRVIGKTGWTRAAKKCFIGAATHGNREVIVAILGSDDMWGDLQRLIEFGFEGVPNPIPRTQRMLVAAAPSGNPAAGDSEEAAPAPGGRFYVRVATFRAESQAKQLRREMRAAGFPAQIYKVRTGGRAIFRVSVGGYGTQSAASAVQRLIRKQRPKLQTLIVRS